jgi:hypothetical protein
MAAARIGEVGGLIDEDAKFIARIARAPATAAQRLTRLLPLAKGQTAPPGPATLRAQAEIDRMIASPALRAEIYAGLDPRAAPS